jgi:hypothetical protein
VTGPIVSPGSLLKNVTVSPLTGLPFASVTVAVAVDVELPSATIDAGANPTVTLLAGAVWVRLACPDMLGETVLSVAVIVADPAVVELVIVAV